MSALSRSGFAACIYAVHDEGRDAPRSAAPATRRPCSWTATAGTSSSARRWPAFTASGDTYPEATRVFPPGSELLLYTDGLVESRTRDLTRDIACWRSRSARFIACRIKITRSTAVVAHSARRRPTTTSRSSTSGRVGAVTGGERGDRLQPAGTADEDRLLELRLGLGAWLGGLGARACHQAEEHDVAAYEAMADTVALIYRNGGPQPGRHWPGLSLTVTVRTGATQTRTRLSRPGPRAGPHPRARAGRRQTGLLPRDDGTDGADDLEKSRPAAPERAPGGTSHPQASQG